MRRSIFFGGGATIVALLAIVGCSIKQLSDRAHQRRRYSSVAQPLEDVRRIDRREHRNNQGYGDVQRRLCQNSESDLHEFQHEHRDC